VASIDNDDSLDLDQLTVAEQRPDGAAKSLVVVSDVDAILRKGLAIDSHARTNTTSVYTAAEISYYWLAHLHGAGHSFTCPTPPL